MLNERLYEWEELSSRSGVAGLQGSFVAAGGGVDSKPCAPACGCRDLGEVWEGRRSRRARSRLALGASLRALACGPVGGAFSKFLSLSGF